MASKPIEHEVAHLREELNRHNYLYYVEAAPRSATANSIA